MDTKFIAVLTIGLTVFGVPVLAEADDIYDNLSIFNYIDTFRPGPTVVGFRARGSEEFPSPVIGNDVLLNLYGKGFDGDNFNDPGSAYIQIRAAEEFTPTSRGAYIDFRTTPIGSIQNREQMRIAPDGNVGIGTGNPASKVEIASDFDTSGLAALTISSYYDTGPHHPAHIYGQRARGTMNEPSPVLDGDFLFMIGPKGYSNTFDFSHSYNASILFKATEDFTGEGMGTAIYFSNTSNGTTQKLDRMIIDQNGNVGIGTTTPESTLQVVGYVQLDLTDGYVPPAEDCDDPSEYGRMMVDQINEDVYVCVVSGWKTLKGKK
jgi:hypothetical protein